MAVCFWTDIVKSEQVCEEDAVVADAVENFSSSSSDSIQITAGDFGIEIPEFPEPTLINLFDLPGATYTLATTNTCGAALSLDLTDGILSTPSVQSTGTCAGSNQTTALTISGSDFPYPATSPSLYAGRLAVAHGSGIAPGANFNAVDLWLFDSEDNLLSSIRYYSLTESDVDDNSGFVHGNEAMGKMAAGVQGDGLRVVINISKNASSNIDYQFSTNFPILVPPPAPTRFVAVIEESWPIEANTGLGVYEFPIEAGTVDGETSSPIWVYASDPAWNNPQPVVSDKLRIDVVFNASLDDSRFYKVGIYSGDDGYTNLVLAGTLKLLPGGGGE